MTDKKSETWADIVPIVDVAKLRDALETICNAIIVNGHTAKMSLSLFDISNIAKFALAAPPRNCDVGTAEDQKCRFLAVCKDKKHYDDVRECPLFVGPNCYPVDCFARWGQMPYEAVQEGDSNGSK